MHCVPCHGAISLDTQVYSVECQQHSAVWRGLCDVSHTDYRAQAGTPAGSLKVVCKLSVATEPVAATNLILSLPPAVNFYALLNLLTCESAGFSSRAESRLFYVLSAESGVADDKLRPQPLPPVTLPSADYFKGSSTNVTVP